MIANPRVAQGAGPHEEEAPCAALHKICLTGPLRTGKTTLWREFTGQPARLLGFSRAPLKDHPEFAAWDSQGGCALDSLGQVFLGNAQAVLVTVAADRQDGGAEAARIAAAVRMLNPTARLGLVLTRADLGICVDTDALAAIAPLFPIVRGRGYGMAALIRFAIGAS